MTEENKVKLANLKDDLKIQLVLPNDLYRQLDYWEEQIEALGEVLKEVIERGTEPTDTEELKILTHIQYLRWATFDQ